MDRPPPPYSETDVFSNAGSAPPILTPVSSNADSVFQTGRQNSEVDDASTTGSAIDTPLYTPPDGSIRVDSFSEDLSSLHLSAAQAYFDSRPVLQRTSGSQIVHEITITSTSTPDDLPYPIALADKDITTQEWATFVNYIIPHHTDVSNGQVADQKIKAELLDHRMENLTVEDKERSQIDVSAMDAQLNVLQPLSPQAENRILEVEEIVNEWNIGFFVPRNVLIHTSVPEAVGLHARRVSTDISSQGTGEPESPNGRRHIYGFIERFGMDSGRDHGRRSGRGRGRSFGRDDPSRDSDRGCGCGGRGFSRGSRKEVGSGDSREAERDIGPESGNVGNNPLAPGHRARPSNRFIRGDQNGVQIGSFLSSQKDSFRFGPMVADKKGIRIGNMFSAGEDGVSFGSYNIPSTKGLKNGMQPPAYNPAARGRDLNRVPTNVKARSHSSTSSSSSSSSSSSDSEGSIPDVDHVSPQALPALKQSLEDWLNHPDQPVSKSSIKALKKELREGKASGVPIAPPSAAEIKALRIQIKSLCREYREAKRIRKKERRAAWRERRMLKRDQKIARKLAKHEAKIVRKMECLELKGKGKMGIPPINVSVPPIHIPPIRLPSWSQGNSGDMGFVIPPVPNVPPVPLVPGMGTRSMTMPGAFPGMEFRPFAMVPDPMAGEGDVASREAEIFRLQREGNRMFMTARAKQNEAEKLRQDAHMEQNEKKMLGMFEKSGELDNEAEEMFETANALVAEAEQLKEYLADDGVMEEARGMFDETGQETGIVHR
jgi:hypothetical protein